MTNTAGHWLNEVMYMSGRRMRGRDFSHIRNQKFSRKVGETMKIGALCYFAANCETNLNRYRRWLTDCLRKVSSWNVFTTAALLVSISFCFKINVRFCFRLCCPRSCMQVYGRMKFGRNSRETGVKWGWKTYAAVEIYPIRGPANTEKIERATHELRRNRIRKWKSFLGSCDEIPMDSKRSVLF